MKTPRSTIAKWSLNAGLVVGLALIGLLVLVSPSQAGVAAATGGNAVANPGFESGNQSWTCRQCNLTVGAPAHSGSAAGQFVSTGKTTRALLYQKDLALQPNTNYELSFWAKSDGKDLQVDLQRQTSPYTNFGLNKTFDVTTQWQEFTVTFTTKGFSSDISNARLRFRAPKGKGFAFSLDDVSLVALDGPPPGPTATPPAGPSPTATTPSQGNGKELLVFSWNGPITEKDHGFPWDDPPMANGNWVSPINYAQGHLYLRFELKATQPPQNPMKVQFCFWQNRTVLETCTPAVGIEDRPGGVAEWDIKLQDMWKKNNKGLNWDQPRTRNGIAIKTASGKPVSDFSGWNWNGENPKEWYPMTADIKVVLVPPGSNFSGWDNYTK